jgi:hemerythrin-like domain-containing protein
MATDTPARPTAFQRPGRIRNGVDFGLMYAAHDAFLRDLDALAAALDDNRPGRPDRQALQAGWRTFTRQLHVHHTAEDTALWPALRARPVPAQATAVLDAMECEHAAIDPLIARTGAALDGPDPAGAAAPAAELAGVLAAHLRHEENDALPLVARYLGNAGWDGFGRELRATHGVRGGSEFIPWLLEGTAGTDRARLLALLPPPVRILYRTVFRRRYARTPRWTAAGAGFRSFSIRHDDRRHERR